MKVPLICGSPPFHSAPDESQYIVAGYSLCDSRGVRPVEGGGRSAELNSTDGSGWAVRKSEYENSCED